MTRQVMGRTSVCMAVPPTWANAVTAGLVRPCGTAARTAPPRPGAGGAAPRLAGTHARSV